MVFIFSFQAAEHRSRQSSVSKNSCNVIGRSCPNAPFHLVILAFHFIKTNMVIMKSARPRGMPASFGNRSRKTFMSQVDTADNFKFDNSYARLPNRFFARQSPTAVSTPRIIRINEMLALELGLDPNALATPDGMAILAGNQPAGGGEPIAMAYAGHQFGNFVPQLGDGRAILLGEVIDVHGVRRDIQLKGSGPTPFSRNGDGRAAIGPVLREYIVAEAMAALGIPTTRALAAVATGESVYREAPLPGAILTRVAASHIRVGTFQYFSARGDIEGIRELAGYVIERHYPAAAQAENRYRAVLEMVIARQADLVARWMMMGFIHGVMNTDNMSIAGETIDYGPCAFMDAYHPDKVFSSIDRAGRYAYGNQPRIAQWNLARLVETFLPILAGNEDASIAEAQSTIDSFAPRFQEAYLAGIRRKLGLLQPRPDDLALSQDLLSRMALNEADFTLTFRRLCDAVASPGSEADVRSLFNDPSAFDEWAVLWRQRLSGEGGDASARRAMMRASNPAFIPRNHRVEEVITAAMNDDLAPFERLVEVLAKPYEDQPEHAAYMDPPRSDQVVRRTFCGT